ncbi:pyridoxamine 5'-phosphate oxidase family protein [Ornithinimicrobium cavernae]|uniref:pyridoxamine 5'-phosphate oxidase family protein n=1 Tax=Ornithinimicrobium cavernae TaxID=2666047 RepID=UPI000D691A50|nr:pyridoxamine 5'-phosphate oxidase family protein [Ornithinimicrobium cavernae]
MDQQQIRAELSEAGAQELLHSGGAAHLAYTGTDGTPRVVPVGFYWTGQEIVVATAATAPKVVALTARPQVALSFTSEPGRARALSVRGTARLTIVDGVVEEYLLAARQSMDAEAAQQFEENVRRTYDRMARIAVTPEWARFYDFGAGRLPGFLQELVERAT